MNSKPYTQWRYINKRIKLIFICGITEVVQRTYTFFIFTIPRKLKKKTILKHFKRKLFETKEKFESFFLIKKFQTQ